MLHASFHPKFQLEARVFARVQGTRDRDNNCCISFCYLHSHRHTRRCLRRRQRQRSEDLQSK